MKNLKISLGGLVLLCLLWTACFKDSFTGIGSERTAFVTFAGRILDEYNDPIAGAQVSTSGEVVVTDDNGVFRLPPMRLPANNAILKVSKAGYYDFSRAYMVHENSVQNLKIQLLQKLHVKSFLAATGGKIVVTEDASIVFPAGAVAYNGEVKVYARYLDPDDANLRLYMPGDLRGINTGGSEQALATFGMMAVELRGQAGEELQLAPGQEAELSMRVPAGKSSVAPPEIPLWHYDLDQARWIEEGSAQKIGSRYVGKVKHFSFWNCDIGLPLIHLDGQVVIGPYGTPIVGATVQLTVLSRGDQRWAGTDANGQFGGAVLMDEAMRLDVLIPSICGILPVFSQTIGPFSADITLPVIQILLPPELQPTEVSGRVIDCAQQPVANGYALLETPSGTFTGFTDGSGSFKVAFVNCINIPQSGFATGYNIVDAKQSDPRPFTLPAATVALSDLAACQTIEEFIQYDMDGESFLVLEPNGYSFDNFTTIAAGDTSDNKGAIEFHFSSNSQPGTFLLTNFWVKKHSLGSIADIQISTTVTEFGVPGQHIAGSFSGTFLTATNGAIHNISGSYRVKRQ